MPPNRTVFNVFTSVQTRVFNFTVAIFITRTDSIQSVKTLKNSKIIDIAKLAQVIFIPEQPRHMAILLEFLRSKISQYTYYHVTIVAILVI